MSNLKEYLGHGESQAISMAELSRLLNISPRACRKAVEAERLTGMLILSSEKGYFLPGEGATGREEVTRFQRRTVARIRAGQAVLRSSRRALEEGRCGSAHSATQT